MKYCIVSFLLLSWLLHDEVAAQPQLWDIHSTSNQPFANVAVDRYESDSLYIKAMGQLIVLHQDTIKYLLRRNKSKFGIGFLIGSIAGGIFANRISHGSDEGPFSEIGRLSSTTLGILIGGSIGGAIGSAQGADTKYQIDKLDSEVKKKLLLRLFPNV